MLQWLAFSTRPLHLEELGEVLAIDVNESPKFDPRRRFDLHDVVGICSSLITVTSSRVKNHTESIVTLAHFSVKEYLTSEVIIQGQALKFSIQEIDCHVSLANDCLAYLLHFDVARAWTEDEVFIEYPLIRYAAKHWTTHARLAEKRDSTLCKEFFLKRGEAFSNWIRLYKPDSYSHSIQSPDRFWRLTLTPRKIASPLYYASLAGLLETVRTLLDMGADVDALGGLLKTALIAASTKGYIKIAQLLLEKGAGVNLESWYGNALQAASSRGYTEIVQLLLEKGAEVNFENSSYGTALQAASFLGYTEIVQLLLAGGADVDLYNPYKRTQIVRLPLEHGPDVNIGGPIDGTALQRASSRGNTEIVRLLLDYGADVNISGSSGTALQIATDADHREIAEMLLEKGAQLKFE